WAQLGALGESLKSATLTKAVIDHHVSNDDLQAVVFKDPSAEATGRLVVDAADALGVPLAEEIAAPLFAAIATDTGWFRFPSTTPRTYEVLARLTATGVRPQAIYSALYEQETLARLRLRGRILAKAELTDQGRVIFSSALA